MDLIEKLAQIVGKANVLTSPKVLERYTSDHSLVRPGSCTCVVRPGTARETAAVVQLANEMRFAVVPQTSGIHFHGAAVPKSGGVILDCSRMNRITDIVPESNTANIQVGVTWGQLQTALEAKGLMSIIPLLPPASRSVIMDWLEYEPPVIYSHEFAGPLRSMQMLSRVTVNFLSPVPQPWTTSGRRVSFPMACPPPDPVP
ncbi:MAG: FAD-binding oxidoreductase [Dehalococcoidia bacterium]|nr:FAD-binding oxidoreductase [Dehalococcoidia bacterium]